MIAVILAAGEGRRMGGPKASLDWNGEPLVVAHVRAARAAGCSRVTAVMRDAVASTLIGDVERAGGTVVVSRAADELGPAGSLAAFAMSGPNTRDARIAIAPVDVVPAAWSALSALVAALARDRRAVAARPRYGTRGGHPVVVRFELLDVYRAKTAPRPLRDVMREYGARVVTVDVDDATVISDLDTPDDVMRAKK